MGFLTNLDVVPRTAKILEDVINHRCPLKDLRNEKNTKTFFLNGAKNTLLSNKSKRKKIEGNSTRVKWKSAT